MGDSRSRMGAVAATAIFVLAAMGLVNAQQKLNRGKKAPIAIAPMEVKMSSSVIALGTGKPTQAKMIGAAAFNPASLTVITKPKVNFRPKQLTSTGDSSGQPVEPNHKVTIAGGKQARADDLVDGTNDLEKTLNDLGYSLYTRENDEKTPIVSLQSHHLDLNVQANELRNLGGMKGNQPVRVTRDISNELVVMDTKPPVIKTTVPGSTVVKKPSGAGSSATVTSNPPASGGGRQQGRRAGQGRRNNQGGQTTTSNANVRQGAQVSGGFRRNTTAGSSAKIVVPPPDFVEIDKTVTLFDKSYGDSDWFSIDFESSLTKKATMRQRKITAQADIKAHLIGKSITLFFAKAEAGGKKNFNTESPIVPTGSPIIRSGRPRSGGGGGGSSSSTTDNESIRILEARCLGDDLISPVNRSDRGKSRQVINGKSVNWEYSVKIPIIPAVSAVGTIGARGSLGVTLVSDGNSEDGEIKIKPSIDTSVYAEAGISVGFLVASVEGGLGAELTLLDYELDISAGIGVTRTNINDKTYIAAATPISVTHNFETLSGRLYGFARVSYWLPFKTREKTLWDGNLIKWNGFTDSRTLYSENSDAVILGESNIPYKEISRSAGAGGG